MDPTDLVSLLARAPRWVRVAFTVGAYLWAFATSLTLFLRAVPEARFKALEASWPAGGRALRALRKFGTDWIPFVKEMAMAVLLGVRRGPPPGPTLVLLVAGVGLVGCSGSAVQTQAAVAHTAALTWNASRPAMVRAYEEDQRGAIDRVCPVGRADCNRAVLEDAVNVVRERWRPVWELTEVARFAHDAWRTELEACRRSDAGEARCLPNVERLGRAFVVQANAWRCAIRAIGHSELDQLPGTAQCPTEGGARDGG